MIVVAPALIAVATARLARLRASVSHVHVAAISPAEVEAYVGSREPCGKAGGYAIQSAAAARIARIDGSYTGIMGLPLYETATLLHWAGVAVSPAGAVPGMYLPAQCYGG